MRRLPILKTLVDILFFIAMIPSFFGLPFIVILAFMPDRVPIKFTHSAETLTNINTTELILLLLLLYAGYIVMVYATYLFRKTLALFSKRIFFDERVIKLLDQTGKAILAGYCIALAPSLYIWLLKKPMELEITLGFNSSLLIIGIGLFFLVLSDVFQMAKAVKEENELTI